MKYTKIGHELEKEKENWLKGENHYYLWGAAGKGTIFIQRYSTKLKIDGVIDIDVQKQGKKIEKITIIAPEKADLDNTKVIVCTEAYKEVARFLSGMGLQENVDFIDYRRFATIYDWYKEGKVYINRTDISVTNRCTLNCEGCNMLMPYYCKPLDRDLDAIKKDIDLLFQWVDTIEALDILGGEPLLYPKLVSVLEYIRDNYQDKIVNVYMYTNGMCLLSKKLLEISKQMDIIYDVSDYTVNLPRLIPRLKKFLNDLDEYEIRYNHKKMDYWLDFGFDTANHFSDNEEQKIEFFHRCYAPFRGLRDKKLFFCHIEPSAIGLGEWEEQEGDAFLLEPYCSEKKIELLEFNLGYSRRGYPSMCMRCDGCCSTKKIPVAIQRKRNGI